MLPLPHERDPGWLRDRRTEPLWHRGYLFDVLAAEVCRRKLKEGLPLLLERACCGDPAEMFRSLPDYLCQTAQPDWDYLLDACVRAIGSAHAGARLWAVETLAMLCREYPEKVRTVGKAAIEKAAQDQEDLVRDAVTAWLSCLKEEAGEPDPPTYRPRE
jgi:hypothetical protein